MMDLEEIRKFCLAFPDATENLQWGDDLCFKIRGKIFATLALTAVPQKLCFKCTPETFAELIEREDIRPAPYVGRYNWVILDRLDALRFDECKEFLSRSYEMVGANAPKRAPKKKTAKVKQKTRKRPVAGGRSRKKKR
jgi:predicted DNA-binding protein (MmcQ/YjbR family)